MRTALVLALGLLGLPAAFGQDYYTLDDGRRIPIPPEGITVIHPYRAARVACCPDCGEPEVNPLRERARIERELQDRRYTYPRYEEPPARSRSAPEVAPVYPSNGSRSYAYSYGSAPSSRSYSAAAPSPTRSGSVAQSFPTIAGITARNAEPLNTSSRASWGTVNTYIPARNAVPAGDTKPPCPT